MTCHPNDYDYGHAGCCGCRQDLDLASDPSASSYQQGNMLLYFFYCPECASHLQAGGEGAFVSANKKVLEEAVAAFPNHTGFAMTTSLALGAHGGDLVKAYEVGVLLPRVLHDAIAEGKAEASFLPPHCWEDAITEGEAEAEATLLPPSGGRAVGWLESDVAAWIFRRSSELEVAK